MNVTEQSESSTNTEQHSDKVTSDKRSNQTGVKDELDEYIRFLNEALKLRPTGHPDRAGTLHNLAWALSRRYDGSGSVADLEESIRLYTEVLELHPAGHPNRAGSVYNLAWALSKRYKHSSSSGDIDESIRLFTEARELYPHNASRRDTCTRELKKLCKRQRDIKKGDSECVIV